MAQNEMQRPEGALIEQALRIKRMSGRQAANDAGISDARWRQIVNGYQSVGAGHKAPVIGPDDTIARMAHAVGVTAEQLREAGRPEAADVLLTLAGMEAEGEWQRSGSVLDRLVSLRGQLDGIIAELAQGQSAAPPRVQVGEPDKQSA